MPLEVRHQRTLTMSGNTPGPGTEISNPKSVINESPIQMFMLIRLKRLIRDSVVILSPRQVPRSP